MTLKLRQKIILLALVAGLLPVLVILLGSYRIKTKMGVTLLEELTATNRTTVSQVACDVYSLCETVNGMLQKDLEDHLALAEERIKHYGGLSLSSDKKLTWEAYNQETKKTETITLPQMMLGDTLIEPVYDKSDISSQTFLRIIDTMNFFGGTCTIFQRINEDGDMLRIATSVINAEGRRGISTYIPHSSEVVRKVLKGQTSMGRAFVLNKWVMTIYKPYYCNGKIIGMIYCGMDLDEIKSIEQEISGIKLGKSGYVTVIRGGGEDGRDKGKYVIAPQHDRKLVGQSIFDEHKDSGDYFNEIFAKALSAEPGKIIEGSYSVKLATFDKPKEKLTAAVYYKPWDWVIISGTFVDDMDFARVTAEKNLQAMLLRFVGCSLGLFLLILIAIFFFSGTIAKPISLVAEIAKNVSTGNLKLAAELITQKIPECKTRSETASRDETSQLICAVSEMTMNLNEIVGQVQHSSVQLLSNATQVSATAKHQEGSLSELGSSTTEIAASIKQISATSADLAGTMNKVTVVAGETAELADDGRSGLEQMENQIRELSSATSSISSKLALINDKTANINNVVTTINKIAEQTNLLSLNAAIEAEKAGEHGQGFSVVAREIRRLADQTANATLDIEQMVKEMQASVSTGVMEMDKFSEAMRTSVEQIIRLGGQFGAIISHVEQLTPKFGIVSDGMQSQSQGAQQINDAMVQLTESTRHTLDAVHELNDAADFMRHAVQALGQIIQKFNVAAAAAKPQEESDE